MISITAISSIVTILTITAFVFIIKRENFDFSSKSIFSNEKLNEKLIQEIYAELRSEALDDDQNEYEADYELLEGKFELLEEKEKEIVEELGSETGLNALGEEKHEADKRDSGTNSHRDIEEAEALDLIVEATHNLKNSGQHRPYTLSLHFSPRSKIPWDQCKLLIEWPLPRNVFIDVWALRRLSPFTVEHHAEQGSGINALLPFWSVKPRHPDLEVGSYDQRARPFILTAEIPFKEQDESPTVINGKLVDSSAPWNLNVHVPDLAVRYQKAQMGGLFEQHKSKKSFLPAPELEFRCQSSDSKPFELKIDWNTHRLRPLAVSIPVGSANPLVAHITIGSVIICSLGLIISLIKF